MGVLVLALALAYLWRAARGDVLGRVAHDLVSDPLGLTAALTAYAAAFALRAEAWHRVLPGLSRRHAWAALHVSLLGNHVLPLRLGEVLRVTSVLRRTRLPGTHVLASALTLRLADLLGVVLLALVSVLAAAPALLPDLGGQKAWVTVLVVATLSAALLGALQWLRRLRVRGLVELHLPGLTVAAATLVAWILEAAVVSQVASAAGIGLSLAEAVAVTAVTVAAQTVAVTPGGFGSYEAAATVTLVALGVDGGTAFAVALTTHAVKTAYSVVVGGIALVRPAPAYWGRLRLPRRQPSRPVPLPVADDAPVVAMIPVYDEEDTVGDIVRRLPPRVHGRPVVALVVDDGSRDASAARAAAAGARVVHQSGNLGLGAAVRRGLADAVALAPAAVVYLDADGEYAPEDLPGVVAPVLAGKADYVVGSRFAGRISRMLPHRRLGNVVLTRWMRWLTRRRDLTDGQSGYRAFSLGAAAHAEIVHDYNYAQVLTLDLLGKGYAYAEVPIRYAFREKGRSFVTLGRYLRKVVPAVHRELNTPAGPPPAG
ncbi:MAG: lysylphosphatidylglycerol synthase domain-containing protein [Actinomycetota bacterium]|nr:lysylphosphatidylglycerol synthase domain-containing protein [Actinomycetota bacterium]